MGKTRQGSLLLGSAFNVGLLAWLAGLIPAVRPWQGAGGEADG